ncbi:hypothetical protein GIB67_035515 [Kingdonia uniflora]|uniref:Uncharacterized protein n=1 Tax=Kingdonia uniflora TaxID=39325 RepID=A0A7J7MC43_9MAGN|nr:hypothetical protein GIB67_035515 [Kingdonia uniflora]
MESLQTSHIPHPITSLAFTPNKQKLSILINLSKTPSSSLHSPLCCSFSSFRTPSKPCVPFAVSESQSSQAVSLETGEWAMQAFKRMIQSPRCMHIVLMYFRSDEISCYFHLLVEPCVDGGDRQTKVRRPRVSRAGGSSQVLLLDWIKKRWQHNLTLLSDLSLRLPFRDALLFPRTAWAQMPVPGLKGSQNVIQLSMLILVHKNHALQ